MHIDETHSTGVDAEAHTGKFGFVTIVGRPSAGKSTLLNQLCGHKVAIVTRLPQTTRNRIRGILSEPRGQLVFVDTPGFSLGQRTLHGHLRTLIVAALRDGDQILYVIDTTRPPGAEEQALTELLANLPNELSVEATGEPSSEPSAEPSGEPSDNHQRNQPLTIALNKIDQKVNHIEEHCARLADKLPQCRQQLLSALNGEGVDDLKTMLFDAAATGVAHYPTDIYTDQTPAFRIAEIIREQAMQHSFQEIPHAIYVEIIEIEQPTPDRLWVRAAINVESESQKAIVIGAGGRTVRAIRRASQQELGRIMPYRIYLDLRVKKRPNWRGHRDLIARIFD